MLAIGYRMEIYLRQTGKQELTPKQRRRTWKKARRYVRKAA